MPVDIAALRTAAHGAAFHKESSVYRVMAKLMGEAADEIEALRAVMEAAIALDHYYKHDGRDVKREMRFVKAQDKAIAAYRALGEGKA